jgi:hypothetical protein
MENNGFHTPPPPPPPPPPPVPPGPPAPPAPPPGPSNEKYQSGGQLSTMDWVQIGVLCLGVYALYNIIDYYRKKAKAEVQHQATVKELKEKQTNLETKFYGFVNQLRRRAS